MSDNEFSDFFEKMPDDDRYYENFDDIPEEAYKPKGKCSFCGNEGKVIQMSYGLCLMDLETGEIVDDPEFEIEPADSVELCKECARFADSHGDMPLEHVEAEYRRLHPK